MKTLIATIALLIAPFVTFANDAKPEAPAPKAEAVYGWSPVFPVSPAKAPFLWNKRLCITEMTATGAAMAADWITTVHVINLPDHWENNSILGKHPSNGKIAAYGAADFAVAGVIGYVAERSHRKPIRYFGRALIAGSIVNHTHEAVCNATSSGKYSCSDLPIGLF